MASELNAHIMAGGKIEFGDRGPEVTDLQTMLGFNTPDGVFGPMTFNQLSLFQAAYGLPASGLVDLPTLAKLAEAKASCTDPNSILFDQVGKGASVETVSYTHLTLPTKA